MAVCLSIQASAEFLPKALEGHQLAFSLFSLILLLEMCIQILGIIQNVCFWGQIISRNWDISQLPPWLPWGGRWGWQSGRDSGKQEDLWISCSNPPIPPQPQPPFPPPKNVDAKTGVWTQISLAWSGFYELFRGLVHLNWQKGPGAESSGQVCDNTAEFHLFVVFLFWAIIPGRFFSIQTEGKGLPSSGVCTWVTARRVPPVVR